MHVKPLVSVLAGLLGLAVVLTGCSSDSQPAPETREREQVYNAPYIPPDSTTGLIFVQKAESGSTKGTAKGAQLTLENVDPTTHWFQNRPDRDAGTETTNQFVERWQRRGLSTRPPNAVIQVEGSEEGDYPVQLSQPEYKASSKTLTYFVTPLGEGDARLPSDFGRSAIFIDDVSEFRYRPIRLTVQDAKANDFIRFLITSEGNRVAWSLGHPLERHGTQGGLELDSQFGQVSLTNLQISNTEITVDLGSLPKGETVTFSMELMLAADFNVRSFALKFESELGATVSAAFGQTATVHLTDKDTSFDWASK